MAVCLIAEISSDSHLFGGVGIARVTDGLVTGDPDRAFDISPSGI